MKDKHFLPLFSTSAGAHLINLLISLGTNDLRHPANSKLSLFFLFSFAKNMLKPRRRKRRECMGDNSDNNKISKRCSVSTQKTATHSHKCASLLSSPSALLTKAEPPNSSFPVLACEEPPGSPRKISPCLRKGRFGLC